MSSYSKINIVYRLQKWMDSVPGQTFLNYAYSWGASVVILGTLFKLTHLPGANVMLFLGMGTEVVVFFLSAFDRPFDKTADGMDIPTHVTDEYLNAEVAGSSAQGGAVVQGGTIVIGGETVAATISATSAPSSTSALSSTSAPSSSSSPAPSSASAPSASTLVEASPVSDVTTASSAAPQVAMGESQLNNPELIDAQSNYVEQLKKLVETLEKVNEQSGRLARDSEEMENLNRTLTGISRVYEMQLKSASQQIGTIDQINDQQRKMAQQIEQLNQIYTRMIEAMTANYGKMKE